jgi:hypothetical protein
MVYTSIMATVYRSTDKDAKEESLDIEPRSNSIQDLR